MPIIYKKSVPAIYRKPKIGGAVQSATDCLETDRFIATGYYNNAGGTRVYTYNIKTYCSRVEPRDFIKITNADLAPVCGVYGSPKNGTVYLPSYVTGWTSDCSPGNWI